MSGEARLLGWEVHHQRDYEDILQDRFGLDFVDPIERHTPSTAAHRRLRQLAIRWFDGMLSLHDSLMRRQGQRTGPTKTDMVDYQLVMRGRSPSDR